MTSTVSVDIDTGEVMPTPGTHNLQTTNATINAELPANSALELEQIKAEIAQYQETNTGSLLEIGRLLVRTKEICGAYGSWLDWLKSNVDISVRQAQRLMRMANWFGDATPVSHLDFSKAYILTRLPKAKVNDFLKQYGTDDAEPLSVIQNMSKRDLEKAIREYLLAQAPVTHTCKEESPETISPVTSPVDSALNTFCHLEGTMEELVKEVLNRPVNDEIYGILVPEIRRLCEKTLGQLPEGEVGV